MENFELLDNLFQIAVLLCACCASGFFALRHKSRSLLILSLAYACFAMGHDLLRAVSGHHGHLAAGLLCGGDFVAGGVAVLPVRADRATEGRRVGFSCPAALAAAVLAATAFLDRDFGPSRLLSALFAPHGGRDGLSLGPSYANRRTAPRPGFLMTGCAALQVLLYLVSNFTRTTPGSTCTTRST